MRHGRFFAGSLTRISDLASSPFDLEPLSREDWADGDYVATEVLSLGPSSRVELPTGRLTRLELGDRVLGALGVRHATLEATGDWRSVGPDLRMELLTGAGLVGRATSVSGLIGPLTGLAYRGHVVRDGKPVRMSDFVRPVPEIPYEVPTILIVGTSMSAGKTTTARLAVRHLDRHGLACAGAKLTGAGRFRDVLSMRDAGAETILDFVDAGLPSTICDEETYLPAARGLLSRLAGADPDVAVIEAGASPLEPYNGAAALRTLGDAVRFVILAASDPYAVLGVMEGFGIEPDLVTGITTNTNAGVELVERLTGVRTINVRDPGSAEAFRDLLLEAVGGSR